MKNKDCGCSENNNLLMGKKKKKKKAATANTVETFFRCPTTGAPVTLPKVIFIKYTNIVGREGQSVPSHSRCLEGKVIKLKYDNNSDENQLTWIGENTQICRMKSPVKQVFTCRRNFGPTHFSLYSFDYKKTAGAFVIISAHPLGLITCQPFHYKFDKVGFSTDGEWVGMAAIEITAFKPK